MVPNDDRHGSNAPAFRVLVGQSRIGDAWEAQSYGETPKSYLRVKFDDPALLKQVNAALFPSEDGGTAQLVWNRFEGGEKQMTIQRNHLRRIRNVPNAEQKSNIPTQISHDGGPPIDVTIPFAQRLTCTIDEACNATGLGRTKLYELIGAGCVATNTIGRRRLVSVRSLPTLLEPKKT